MKVACLLISLLMPCFAYADNCLLPLLNQITLPLRTEQWVTTKTALVNVGVSAAVTGGGIEKVQQNVLNKLNQLSNKGAWHIVSFDRQQDKSGLENIQITAQARLMQDDLALLRDKAKKISQPGETYIIDNVQFTPSEDELRQANANLRANLYQQAKAELDTLNKLYPDQKYYLHQIDFTPSPPPVAPMAAMYKMSNENVQASAPLSVGNKQELQATVVLASMPDQLAQKLPHPAAL